MDTQPPMTNIPEMFLLKSRSLIVSDYLPKIERCLEGLSDDDVWWRPNEASNSIGNLLLHLGGNLTQWIIGGVGGDHTSGIDNRSSTSEPASPPGSCSGDYEPLSKKPPGSSAGWTLMLC